MKVKISRLLLLAGASVLSAPAPSAVLDHQHDFDWEIGRWATDARILKNPLTGESPKWAEYHGESLIKPLLQGRMNFVELAIEGPAGKISSGSLRLYNPAAAQWSLNFVNVRNGLLTPPVFGNFGADGTGTFVGSDVLDGKAILVRFVITRPSKKRHLLSKPIQLTPENPGKRIGSPPIAL